MTARLYPAHVQAAVEIRAMPPGAIYSFERLAAEMGLDVDHPEVRISRLKLLAQLREWGVNVAPIRGHGYQRLSERARVHRQARLALAKVRRTLSYVAQDLRTVDAAQLENADVRFLSDQQAKIGTLSIWARLKKPQRYTVAKLPPVPRLHGGDED